LLLFHRDPERFVSGAFVKIGFFRTESDLAYHDEVHGDLFTQVAATIDMLRTKYLKAAIRYEGIQRIESFPVPDAALREALLNALVHRDYAVPAPVQIRVYEDRLGIWNPAVLPEGWALNDLLREHASLPFNPNVANAFFRAGEIEAWGRGIQLIFQACRDAGAPKPRIRLNGHDLWLEFDFSSDYLRAVSPTGDTAPSEKMSEKTSEKTSEKILSLLSGQPSLSLSEVATAIGRSSRTVERAVAKLAEAGRLKRIGPDKGGHWKVLP
jgi:ATP-dependent DNA helicase RecG